MRTGNTLVFDGEHTYNALVPSSATEVILNSTGANHLGTCAFFHDGSGMPTINGSCVYRQVNYVVGKVNVLYFLYDASLQSCVLNAQPYEYFAPPNQETHVFLIAGQSNMRPNTGVTGIGQALTYPNTMKQWGRFGVDDGKLKPATTPLDNYFNDTTPDLGPGLTTKFFDRYQIDNPNVLIVVIPCAKGGSGFAQNDWNKGDLLYQDTVDRSNDCLSQNPTFIFKGIIWHQGENDSGNTNYQNQLDNFIDDIRTDITGATNTTPFILGGQLPEWVEQTQNAQDVCDIVKSTPCRKPNTAFASSFFPTRLTGWDGIHFGSISSQELGDRYYNAYLELTGQEI